MDTRPTWDEYFLGIAVAASKRSTCDRAMVGCVLVSQDNQILSTGYNGLPKGEPHCSEVGHQIIDSHCCRTIHAESNAIIQAASHGVAIKGATAYVTHFPCYNCAKMLVNAGIVRLVYAEDYRVDPLALQLIQRYMDWWKGE